jgi:hypothetical protein
MIEIRVIDIGGTYEDYLGLRGLRRMGKKKWPKHVDYCLARLVSALHLDDVVLGGGAVKLTAASIARFSSSISK